MNNSKLSPELVSLIHHVELNKSGWWEKATKQLLLTSIYKSDKNLEQSEIEHDLKQSLSINIDSQRINTLLNDLCSSDTLIRLPDNKYKFSEQSIKRFLEELKNSQMNDENVKNKFIRIIKERCPNINADECWLNFNEHFLFPYIKETGARTYEFISGKILVLDKIEKFYTFLKHYGPDCSELVKKAVLSFLDPQDINVRSYIIKYLNAYFFLEACNLNEDTLKALYKTTQEKRSFNIFVDTNFLFAFLGMSKDYFNEAANSLIEILKKLPNSISIKLNVSSITLTEARIVLEREVGRFGGARVVNPKLARIGLEADIDDFYRYICRETLKIGHEINASEHIKVYLHNLSTMLEDKNINISKEDIDRYKDDKRVQIDINRELEYEYRRYGAAGKTRARLAHDIALWYYVNDKRPQALETPMDARCWILTINHRFMDYDIRRQKNMKLQIPLCTFPASIIQMLQFWIPRDQYFEDRLFKSFRASLFQQFDAQSEKITARILETLTYYENINTLSNEAIKKIYLNEALRKRMEPKINKEKSDLEIHKKDEEIEKMVGETIIEEMESVKKEVDTLKDECEKVKGDYEVVKGDFEVVKEECQAIKGEYETAKNQRTIQDR